MSFETIELSPYEGAPQEMFEFLQGANAWRFTSGDRELTHLGQTYVRETLSRTAMDFSREDSAASIVVRVPRTNPVAALFVPYNPPTPIALIIYQKHRADAEVVIGFVGTVISFAVDAGGTALTCAPISQALKRTVPSIVFQNRCNWALFGAGCGVDRAAFKVTGLIDSVAGADITASEWDALADGWFTSGYVQRASGERRFVLAHVGGTLTLMSPFPTAPTIGQSVDAYPGCQRSEAVCETKFSNLVRHMGWARIPTRNPYEGSIV